MKIINPDNYPDLSETDLARYRELTCLIQQLAVMMDTMSDMQKEGNNSLAFSSGFTAATTGLMKFHLPGMVERIENSKFRSDCRQTLFYSIGKLKKPEEFEAE